MSSEGGQTEQEESVSTNMTAGDWQDVADSEFVDVANSAIKGDVAFVFDHDEIGLHGFRWRSDLNRLEAASFEEVGE